MQNRKFIIPFGEAADFSIDYLLGIFVDARAVTIRYVNNISKAELHWQYAEGWNTIGALLAHIIACAHYFRIYFAEERRLTEAEEKLYYPGLEMGKHLPELITSQPVEFYIDELEKSQILLFEAINKLSTADFHKKREGYSKETGCNLAWVLYHLAEDEVHHRGQISLLRKLYKTLHQA